jgi:hypothetical protein
LLAVVAAEEVASAVLDVASFDVDAPVWRGLHAVPLVGRKGQAWGDAALHVQLLASKRKVRLPVAGGRLMQN